MLSVDSIRQWLLTEAAESGHPVEFLDAVKQVITSLETDNEILTDDVIRLEVWGDEE